MLNITCKMYSLSFATSISHIQLFLVSPYHHFQKRMQVIICHLCVCVCVSLPVCDCVRKLSFLIHSHLQQNLLCVGQWIKELKRFTNYLSNLTRLLRLKVRWLHPHFYGSDSVEYREKLYTIYGRHRFKSWGRNIMNRLRFGGRLTKNLLKEMAKYG